MPVVGGPIEIYMAIVRSRQPHSLHSGGRPLTPRCGASTTSKSSPALCYSKGVNYLYQFGIEFLWNSFLYGQKTRQELRVRMMRLLAESEMVKT